MKKLPELYKNTNINIKDNNKRTCYINENNEVDEVLDIIFNGLSSPYQKQVEIKTTNNIYETYLVHKTSNNITTLDNIIIPIKDIEYIKIKTHN